MKLGLLFVVALLVSVSYEKNHKTNNGFFVWNGFNFEWSRDIIIVGIRKGHELGNFGAYLESETHTISDEGVWTGKATAEMEFKPGNDGDIANPQLYYSAAYSSRVYASDPLTYHFHFSDNATQKNGNEDSKVVTAEAEYSFDFVVNVPNGYQQSDVLLDGFSMDMSCDPSKQKDGYPCNSDSDNIYVTELEVDLQKCTALSDTELTCTIEFKVGRATTSGSIPKDFTWSVDYAVKTVVRAISANKTDAYFHKALRRVTQKGGIHDDAGSYSESITTQNDVFYDSAMVGVAGFGFRVSSLESHDGRPLDGFTFYLDGGNTYAVVGTNGSYTSTLDYSYSMGVTAPETTIPANTHMWHRTSLIQLSNATTIPSSYVEGTVCQSDGIFICQLHGVALDHTTTSKKITVEELVV